jgi:hypothetical protein
MKMRKKDGTFATTEAENAKVLLDQFFEVMNCNELSAYDPTVLQEIDSHPVNTTLDIPPTSTEIKAALKNAVQEDPRKEWNTNRSLQEPQERAAVSIQETHHSFLAKQPVQPGGLATNQTEHFTKKG